MLATAARCQHPDGPHHDCEYVRERNRLIPAAARMADEAVGPEPTQAIRELPGGTLAYLKAVAARGKRWDAAFHRAMDRLARDTGLVG